MTKKQLRKDSLQSVVYGLEDMKRDIENGHSYVLVNDAHNAMGRAHTTSYLGVMKADEFKTINHEVWEIVYGLEDQQLARINSLIETVSGWIQ